MLRRLAFAGWLALLASSAAVAQELPCDPNPRSEKPSALARRLWLEAIRMTGASISEDEAKIEDRAIEPTVTYLTAKSEDALQNAGAAVLKSGLEINLPVAGAVLQGGEIVFDETTVSVDRMYEELTPENRILVVLRQLNANYTDLLRRAAEQRTTTPCLERPKAATTRAPRAAAAAIGRFVLQSVVVKPETAPEGWEYAPGGTTAELVTRKGDTTDYAWSPPPPELPAGGLPIPIAVTANARAVPRGRAYATIGITPVGFDFTGRAEDLGADCTSEDGQEATGSKTVMLRPRAGATRYSVKVSMGGTVSYEYVYKRVP
jgi:hypothetical protein